ncbi:hypothetical protein ACFLIM_25195 [Nonomuraea sp. M3C6]|uniref:Uncharacterized protein n=1 Tax=Nonomuraea marmarensis TaxID=3351344 RepID=A0ABW7AJX9_9ACTN
MKVLNDGLEEDVMVALLLIEALHDEAGQDGAPVPARYPARGWEHDRQRVGDRDPPVPDLPGRRPGDRRHGLDLL